MSLTTDTLDRLHLDEGSRHRLRVWAAVVILEVYAVIVYFLLTDATPTGELRYLAYPIVWTTLGLWVLVDVEPDPGSRAHAFAAGALATLYFGVLLWIPGNIGLTPADSMITWRVEMYAPGWGPLVAATTPWIRVFLVPFEVIGYLGLAFLVYANVLTLARGALSSVLGLVTCVGCTVPVLVPLLGVLGGPATSLTTTAYAWSYDIGTAIFVVTVGLLYHSYGGSPP